MRQAGRYMPEYRALRKDYTILELIKTPELAAEVTLQPVKAFDVDAAIIFADILTLPEAMGLELEFIENLGPVFHNPIRSEADVSKLKPVDPSESLRFTMEAIENTVKELDGRLPLIGFSGAPFTLASYAIRGSSREDLTRVKQWMYAFPEAWHRLMNTLSEAVILYLSAQAKAGADALQLFDSWVGILSPQDYREYVQPHMQLISDTIRSETSVPLIHFGTDTAGLLPMISALGFDVIGLDWRVPLKDAWKILGAKTAIQGNLDPAVLLASHSVIRRQAALIIDGVRGRSGHIFNLGHGVIKDTPTEHVSALVEFVHDYSKCNASS